MTTSSWPPPILTAAQVEEVIAAGYVAGQDTLVEDSQGIPYGFYSASQRSFVWLPGRQAQAIADAQALAVAAAEEAVASAAKAQAAIAAQAADAAQQKAAAEAAAKSAQALADRAAQVAAGGNPVTAEPGVSPLPIMPVLLALSIIGIMLLAFKEKKEKKGPGRGGVQQRSVKDVPKSLRRQS